MNRLTFALVSVSLVVGVVLAVSAASAKIPITPRLGAALTVGQVVPHPKGTKVGASGRFTATLTGTKLQWTLSFAALSGPATTAQIHSGPRGKRGPLLVRLCGPCTSPENGTATLTAGEIAPIVAGKDYADLHTAKNPNGELRGQISCPC